MEKSKAQPPSVSKGIDHGQESYNDPISLIIW
jgi:hypothetical protein